MTYVLHRMEQAYDSPEPVSPQVHGHYNIIHIKNQYNIDSIVTHGIKNTPEWGGILFLEDNHPQKSLIFAGPGLVGLSPSVLVRGDTRKKSPEWGDFISGGPGRTRTDTPCRT